ncbi:conserved hypothetical protein [Ricinus communis]|uniref:Uncharacterized protein n=1 Tax=Ricinus communis TaxID=3988 RepID=B9TPR2_RICCO|nr:conserved hypothetical protein [Ricinus communis]
MEESTLSGGYNDTTMISYDFQAPLGPDGQQRKVLEKLRPFPPVRPRLRRAPGADDRAQAGRIAGHAGRFAYRALRRAQRR